jgi:cytosine/adenosine deaminase-related metal-dependent hydrolase
MQGNMVLLADYIVTMDEQRTVIQDGAVVVEGNRIVALGKKEILNEFPQAEVLGGSGKIVLPGLVNCHMHLPQMLMRGVADNVEPLTKLGKYIWPIQGNFREEDGLAASRLAFLEMIKAGTTCFLSTGLHPRYGIQRICSELLNSGLRGVISKYLMETGSYSKQENAIHPGLWEEGETSIRQAIDLIEHWNGAENGRIYVWLSPRSVGSCSKEFLQRISEIAHNYSVGITAHWAEVPENTEYIQDTYSLTPGSFAKEVGLLTPKTVFAHGIFFPESDFPLLEAAGTSVCHCPVCNSKLAMGVANIPKMLASGVNVCLGNDGVPVNNTADMFREMRTFCLLQRMAFKNPTFPTAEVALSLATINGARALGLEDEIGSIELGKKADLIVLDYLKPHFIPLINPLSAIVWSASGADVETSIVDGKVLMHNRQALTLDEPSILKEAQLRSSEVLARAGLKKNAAIG